jgi:cell division protein FtsI (penicillin-binding protein 3)
VGAHGYEDRYHSLFAGLAPTSAPRIVTVVVVDDASLGKYHGGDVAAPVFGKVVGGAMRLLNVAPDAVPQAVAKGETPAAGKGPV